MKSLLKRFKTHPTDVKTVFELEKHLKKNWKYYSGEREYSYLVFSDSFSQLLMKIENKEITTDKEVLSFFSYHYKSNFDKLNQSIQSHDTIELVDTVNRPLLNIEDLEPAEVLIFYAYLNNKILTPTVKKILTKISYSVIIDDELFIKKLSESNFVTMYLSNELGSKKFMEFSELVNMLGIYYPMINIPDTDVLMKLKEGILNKFLGALDSDKVENLLKLEDFIFKN